MLCISATIVLGAWFVTITITKFPMRAVLCTALQALLVVPPSVLQTALASASQQLGRPTQELLQLLLAEPGAVLGLGYLGGSQGAAESWAQRLGLDQQARLAFLYSNFCILNIKQCQK
jgi:hypothetical protein